METAGGPPRVQGVLETALYVEDVETAARFYTELFGFGVLFRDDRLCALDVAAGHVLLLFLRGASREPIVLPTGSIPPHDGSGQVHFAFSVRREDLEAWRGRLAERSIPVEAEVQWARGGTSLYFRDPDGHLGELATPGLWATY